jgi:diguanylate cyclase (GGDEF)-like protein
VPDPVVTLVSFACGIITIGFYIAFRISKNYELVSMIAVIFISFVVFPALWIITGGTRGSIPYYIIINAGIIALLLDGLKRKIIFFLYALVIGGLIVIEYHLPVIGYNSDLIRSIDFAFDLYVCLFSSVILIAVLIDSYMDEFKKSEKYLAALKEQNKEIEAKNRLLEKSNSELIKAKEKAEKLSITDYLTGTYNKRFITLCLNEEIGTSRKKQKKLTAALIDVDNFKTINDTYGHMYGDYVLERISKTIISSLRKEDLVGRFGGDEFLIILPDTNREEGHAIMERVRQKILELKWETDLVVTISGGVIEIDDDKSACLLTKLDQLLYRAKHKSKNMIEYKENCN